MVSPHKMYPLEAMLVLIVQTSLRGRPGFAELDETDHLLADEAKPILERMYARLRAGKPATLRPLG